MYNMELIAIRVPESMARDIEEAVEDESYATKSELMRAAIREWLDEG